MSVLLASIRRGVTRLASRKTYLAAMVFVPIVCAWFFASVLDVGVPQKVPTAVVDLDHSTMSRSMTRSLNAQQLIDVTMKAESYESAMEALQKGDIYGFYVIPYQFETDALAGKKPTISYVTNLTYFVPGTFTYKGFKTIAVSTAAAVVAQVGAEMGATDDMMSNLVQPVELNINPINNPWTNYSYYLGPSFTFGVLELMIFLVTIFSITSEIKNYTSRRWLATGGDSIIVALFGKLLPQTILFTAVGWAIESMMFGWFGYPCNGSPFVLYGAMVLFVMACQAFGVFFASLLPNPRLALSSAALIGMLAFSVTGFSFPVENMYGAVAIFSYILPVRYMLLIYLNTGLNGFDIYFARTSFIALVLFLPIGTLFLWHLKQVCRRPVYVP